MRFLRFLIMCALLVAPSLASAQRAYWTQSIDAQTNCIADGGGLCILDFAETGSAVIEVTITNAATGGAADIAATGESNADLQLSADGTGEVRIIGSAVDLPSSDGAAPDAEGELVLDTSITDHLDMFKFHDGSAEHIIISILTADLTTTEDHIIKYDAGANKFTMEPDVSGGSPAWETISDPGGAQTLDMGIFATDWNFVDTADTSIDAFTITFDESNVANVNDQRLLVLRRLDGGAGEEMDALLVLDNADTDDIVIDAIEISAAGGGGFTNMMSVTANVTNFLVTPNDTITLTEVELLAGGTRTDEALCTYETTGNQLECSVGVVRGDLLVGDSSTEWAQLSVGAAGLVHLINDATDVFWDDSDSLNFLVQATASPAVNGGLVIDTDADNANIVDDVLSFQSGSTDYHIPSMRVYPTLQTQLLGIDTTANQFVYKTIVGGTNITVVGADATITIDADSIEFEIEVNLDEMFLLIPVSNGPQAELVGGANFVQEALAFDPTADFEEVYIRFPIDNNYSDTAIVCNWIWEATETINEACWCMDAADAPLGAIRDPSPEVTAQCVSTTVGGTASFLVETEITLTGTFAGGNMFLARLFRDGDESESGCATDSDDLTGDARLLTGSCKYDVTVP